MALSLSLSPHSSLPLSLSLPLCVACLCFGFYWILKGARFYPQFESSDFFANDLDVVVFAVSILSFEEVLKNIPPKFLSGKLVVDVLSVKMHPKQILIDILPADADVL